MFFLRFCCIMVKQLRVEALLLALRFSWPFLAPAFIMAVVASTSKRMRQAAFDAWVEEAIQAALPAAPDVLDASDNHR